MNNINLIGRITNDLQLEQAGESLFVEFGLAVDGIKEDDTMFVNVKVWNKQAETMVKYLGKGREVGISGRLSIRAYKDKQGNNRSYTEVIANKVTFVGSAKENNEQPNTTKQPIQDQRATTSSGSLFR